MRELRCLSASGQLGFGIPKPALETGYDRKPHFIGADMGSTDLGPYYLGSGKPAATDTIIRRDLQLVLDGAHRLKVPLIIGSAGTAGAKPHLAKTMELVKKVCKENGYHFKTAVIHADIAPGYVLEKLAAGKVKSMRGAPALNAEEVSRSSHIVAQMGIEPFIAALKADAQLIIAGRSLDTSVFTAMPVLLGYDRGLALHMAKIIECASLCADPGGRDAILATLGEDSFVLESQNPTKRTTPVSVAAHTLYEQEDPYYVQEAGGVINLGDCKFEQLDERRTRVSGAKWSEVRPYMLKLEGARSIGHRVVAVAGFRDPIMIEGIDEILAGLRTMTSNLLPQSVRPDQYRLQFRLYGRDAVMGTREFKRDSQPHEIGLMVECVADSYDLANTVCSLARYNLMHIFYPRILATGGNLALPFTPSELYAGEAYEFNVYHLVEESDPLRLFPIEYVNI
jgi:hypothetical protein